MNINGKYKRKQVNEDGNVEIVFELTAIQHVHMAEQLQKDCHYRIKLDEIKSKRTIEQNNYMWALIHDISEARNSRLATSDDDWEVYLEALEKAQAKCEIVAIKPEAVPMLKQSFRAVRELNHFITEKGVEMAQCKVFYGSSKMDATEMAKLIDIVLMMAQQEGVEIKYYG